MSLLMEALRKAEAAKRAGQDAADADSNATVNANAEIPGEVPQPVPEVFKYTSSDDLLALSPREDDPGEAPAPVPITVSPAPSVRTEPRINDHDDVLDDYLTTSHEHDLDELPTQVPSRERVKIQEQRERAAAASMFDAKVPQENLNNKRRQRMQILASALAIVVMMIGGGWWYLAKFSAKSGIGVNQSVANYNLQRRGFLGEQPADMIAPSAGSTTVPATATAAGPATTPLQNAQVAATATGADNTKSPIADIGKTVATPNIANTAEVSLAVSDPRPNGRQESSQSEPANPNAVPPAAPATNAAGASAAGAVSQPAANILEISRSNTASKVQPAIQSAYNQLQKGNLPAANDLYQELANRYPNNRDALLGLAAVQLKLGNENGARLTYAHLLKLNPLDALAHTGMLQTIPSTNPATYEKDLLALRQQFPTVAPLSFALGNHYAKLERWHEAQSAYFDALSQARHDSGSSVSPDYAFNLAVSLEQLGQKRAALEYYKQAELLAITAKPGFDPMMLRQRLTELEQHP